MSRVFFMVLFFVPVVALAQLGFGLNVANGVAYNHPMGFHGGGMQRSLGGFVWAGGIVQYSITSGYMLETGALFQTIFLQGKTPLARYHSRTLKFAIPLKAGVSLLPKTTVLAGVQWKNNRDFFDLHIRKKNNFRADPMFSMRYQYRPFLALAFNLMYNPFVSSAFIMNDPRWAFSVGMIFRGQNNPDSQ